MMVMSPFHRLVPPQLGEGSQPLPLLFAQCHFIIVITEAEPRSTGQCNNGGTTVKCPVDQGSALVKLFLDADAGIDGDDILAVGKQRVDVHLLDFGSEAQHGRESHDDLDVKVLVQAFPAAGALDNPVTLE